jgi:hypothetical protein
MYTKTRISQSAIDAVGQNTALGQLLVTALRGNATLVITNEDISQLKTLPTGIWNALKDDITKRRIKWRRVPDEQWFNLADASIEVVIEEPASTEVRNPLQTEIVGYTEAPPVALRSDIRSGSRHIEDRDQFWQQCLLPVIESTHPRNRRVHLIDQYAFQDVFRISHTRRGQFRPNDLLNSGFVWLLTRLNSASESLPSKLQFTVTASASLELGAEQIRNLLETLTNKIDTSNLEITAHVISATETRLRPPGFIARRLIINDIAQFQLSHGMRDFSLPRDESALSGVFLPSCNDALRKAIHDLGKLDQTTMTVEAASPLETN